MRKRHERHAAFLLTLAAACGGKGGGTPGPTPMTCTNISGNVDAMGLPIRKPDADAAGCHVVDNPDPSKNPPRVCMKKTPDLSCVGMPEPYGTPMPVTLRGCVKAFGLADTSFGLMVEVFRERNADGSPADPGYDVHGMPGVQVNKTPAAFVGKASGCCHMVNGACALSGCSTQVDASKCADGGSFEVPDVPTETDLVVRVTDRWLPNDLRSKVDTYQYGIIIRSSTVTCSAGTCSATREANTISIATFKTIPPAAGVSVIRGEDNLYDGIGEGHLAGEIRDCTSLDKVQNAVAAIDASARKLAYFNVGFPPTLFNIDDPKPDATRSRTNGDGLYAAIGVETMDKGLAVRVGAAVTKSVCGTNGVCKCNADGTPNPAYTGPQPGENDVLLLGTRRVFVFPDSITILTFDRALYTHP